MWVSHVLLRTDWSMRAGSLRSQHVQRVSQLMRVTCCQPMPKAARGEKNLGCNELASGPQIAESPEGWQTQARKSSQEKPLIEGEK